MVGSNTMMFGGATALGGLVNVFGKTGATEALVAGLT